MIPKVSIIIAVYNCEKYIESCARSLFEQTLDDIEYIFVNDATPDKSIIILNNVIMDYNKGNKMRRCPSYTASKDLQKLYDGINRILDNK